MWQNPLELRTLSACPTQNVIGLAREELVLLACFFPEEN